MKQIDQCFERWQNGLKPLASSKWKLSQQGSILILTHYHHRILQYCLLNNRFTYAWYEKPADKRGLVAAVSWCASNLSTPMIEIEKYKKTEDDTDVAHHQVKESISNNY